MSKFSVGDTVKVANPGETYDCNSLAADSHHITRFGKWEYGKCPVRQLNATVKDSWQTGGDIVVVIEQDSKVFMIGEDGLEMVEKAEKKFGKKDLKSGMVVQYKCGDLRLVIEGVGLVSKGGNLQWEDITFIDDYTYKIVKVYEPNKLDKPLNIKKFMKDDDVSGFTVVYDAAKNKEAEKVQQVIDKLQSELEEAQKKLKEMGGK